MSTASACATLLMAAGLLLGGSGASNALAGNAGRSSPGGAPAPCRWMTTGTPAYTACVTAQHQKQQALLQLQQQHNRQATQVQ